ncbi:MAG: precorrin-2 dehydrogenase/sirohydrochlorin ferrochelatase family protein [Candidatus Rokuibacteriota bacterium]
MSAFLFPVMLDLEARECLVVGAGVVAARKVAGLLDAGARVTVVSPVLAPAVLDIARDGRLRWWPREYAAGDVAGFALVMVATDDDDVNARVAAEARERSIWVNCADDPARCDFILPSVLRRGPLTVAVSTGGASPTVAHMVREELEAVLPPDYAALTEMVADVRRGLRERGIALDAQRWRDALDGELKRLVAAGRPAEARNRLRERLGV